MFKTKKARKRADLSPQSIPDLSQVKNNLVVEKSVVKKFKTDLHKFDELEQAHLEQARTTLTDAEIAKTVQVEIESSDDIEEFIRKNLEDTRPFKK